MKTNVRFANAVDQGPIQNSSENEFLTGIDWSLDLDSDFDPENLLITAELKHTPD